MDLKDLNDQELMLAYWEAQESQNNIIGAIKKEFDRRVREA